MDVLKKSKNVFSPIIILLTMVVYFCLPEGELLASAGEPDQEKITVSQAVHLQAEIENHEIIEELYYRLLDEKGRQITVTGKIIRPGDRYLDACNNLYEVYRVEDYTAYARLLRSEAISSSGYFLEGKAGRKPGDFVSGFDHNLLLENQGWKILLGRVEEQSAAEDLAAAERRKLVAIYHTHNAESYLPSDGTHSIYGQGGIHKVGQAFTAALEEKEVDVIHSEQLHLPHDRGAYRRSRNTVLALLDHVPDVIFDLHRDAAPIEEYSVEIEGDWVAQVQFVVGRQNPAFHVTRQFAYDLKALADQVYPGLVKGVFMGWGNYNQDLMPLKLLLEAGGHQNSREAAKDGIELFSDVVALYFYGIPVEEGQGENKGAIRPPVGNIEGTEAAAAQTVFGLILLVAAGTGGFYLLNNPQAAGRIKGKAKENLSRIYGHVSGFLSRLKGKNR